MHLRDKLVGAALLLGFGACTYVVGPAAIDRASSWWNKKEPIVQQAPQYEQTEIIAVGTYRGTDTTRARGLARTLTSNGFDAQVIEGRCADRSMEAEACARVLIDTPTYRKQRDLVTYLSNNVGSLPGSDTNTLIPGERQTDGTYEWRTIDDEIKHLLNRYVTDYAGTWEETIWKKDKKGNLVAVGKRSWPVSVTAENAKRDLSTYMHPIIRQESGYKYWARSDANAIGLAQVTPETAESIDNERATHPVFQAFRDRVGEYKSVPLSHTQHAKRLKFPVANLDDAIANLWRNYVRCDGVMDCVLASYNAGPGNTVNDRWRQFPETRNYVASINAMVERASYDLSSPAERSGRP